MSGGGLLKNPEQSAPANFSGVEDGARIGKEAIDERAGFPRRRGLVDRHVNHDRSSDDVGARDTAGEAGVQRIAAIVAHDEEAVGGNGVGKDAAFASEWTAKEEWLAGLGNAGGVGFVETRSIDPHGAVVDVDGLAGKPDHALDDIGAFAGNDRAKDYDLLALRTAPQRDVKIGEGDPGVVADAAHDQVIADQQGVFHGARRDHARLTDGAIDQHEDQRDPNPGDD